MARITVSIRTVGNTATVRRPLKEPGDALNALFEALSLASIPLPTDSEGENDGEDRKEDEADGDVAAAQ